MIIKLLIYSMLAVSGMTLIKMGSTSTQIEIIKGMFNAKVSGVFILGCVMYVLSFLTWLSLIKENELSYIFPVANGIVTVTTVLIGMFILNETVRGTQWLGVGLILLGIVIVNIFK